MILDDIPQVVYAPVKAFKKIIENPKYLGAIIILVLFIGVMIGFEYVQFSKTYVENTSPTVNNLPNFLNATNWQSILNVTLSNNYNDFYNYSVPVIGIGTNYSLFGNSSLEMDAANLNSLSAALGNTSYVDCIAPSGFLNLSMTIKQATPAVAPQSATLTLYSVTDTNSYQYSLTSALSNTADIGVWNNITIPLGKTLKGGNKQRLPDMEQHNSSPINLQLPSHLEHNYWSRRLVLPRPIRIANPVQRHRPHSGVFRDVLSAVHFRLVLLTGFIYLFFKGLKSSVVWKPMFIATGFAMFVMVIRALVNLAVAATLPTLYYPYDLSLGVSFNTYGAIFYPPGTVGALTAQSQAIFNSINSATANFRFVTSAMFVVGYIWLGALCTIIVGTLKPEFSMMKRVLISAVSIAVTILLLLLLVGIV